MLAWDSGGVLREQVILQQAARDGARVAATAYSPGAAVGTVQQAVLDSARDLPGLSGTPGFMTLSYPDGGLSVQVVLVYDHALSTPVLRNLWGGAGGTVRLQASATFFVPQLTAVPAAVVTSTPIPTPTPVPAATNTPTSIPPTNTPTPTLSPTPTVTPTPTLTPIPPLHCTITVPPLSGDNGYIVLIQTNATNTIKITWTMRFGEPEAIDVYVVSWPGFQLVGSSSANAPSVSVTTPPVAPGYYVIDFYKRTSDLPWSTSATIDFMGANCPP
jgi:hypothetical protein